MARLIDASVMPKDQFWEGLSDKEKAKVLSYLITSPTVNAVEVQDEQLLKAIKLLIEQYEHSKKSDYVHSPVAHAFYHTWKQLDAKMNGDTNG